MKTAAYTRYSSDAQREASTRDQLRNIVAWCERAGWPAPAVYSDEAISGARADRPEYARLLAVAESGHIDAILVDDLSRLSRDQIETARAVRLFKHWGVRLVGVSDGVDTERTGHELEVGLRGIMSEAYLRDLAEKTHRGLKGQALDGKSAGGLPYGYKSIALEDGYGRAIDADQAAIVRRIYERFAAGASPRTIAAELNADAVASPRQGAWVQSAIYGDTKRGIGILANPIYRGRLIWNRSRWVKHPETGRRLRRERPESEWIVHDDEALRIVPQDLWESVQARIGAVREKTKAARAKHGQNARSGRPSRHLLSGILRCGICGAPMTVSGSNPKRYGCSTHRDRGTCDMRYTVPQAIVENKILEGLRSELLTDEAFALFEREARAMLKQQQPDVGSLRQALAKAERERDNIMHAIRAGIVTDTTKQALLDAESTIDQAQQAIDQAQSNRPEQILPRARDTWRNMVEHLADVDDVNAARDNIKALIGEVKVMPDGDELVAEMAAGASAILRTISVVAGARFETYSATDHKTRIPLRALNTKGKL